jgi:apolipoprotein N-acyltransferase
VSAVLLRIGSYLENLSGWQRVGVAFTAGAVSALGFAPFNLFALFLLGVGVLVALLDGGGERRVLRAALLGWMFGFGQFVVGMHWIFYPFLVDPVAHAWQIPFVAVLFPGGLALFIALAAATAASLRAPGQARAIIFAVCYATTEWLRGHLFTGLPWNLPAYSWEASLAVLQSASIIGACGLSFLTILFGASLAELVARPRRVLLPIAMFAVFVLIWLGGELRLIETPSIMLANVNLRVVQPNIPQDEKYRHEFVRRNWQRLVDLSLKQPRPSSAIIIWPEAAPPVLLQSAPDALAQIAVITGPNNILITGNQHRAFDSANNPLFYNSLYIFGHSGQLLSTYDKFHLVPFGEFMPYEATLRALGFTKLVDFPGSFSAGEGPQTYRVPGAPDVGPLICYEILFPGAVIGERRPAWLVNVTDDSWFGPWAGPRQHLLAARVRAIEEGLPVVRSANTGISAIIDPLGRLLSTLGLDQAGEIDSRLPRALAMPLYARFGDAGFVLMLMIGAGLSWWLARK